MMLSSPTMIFTKSTLPKLISLAGFILFNFFNSLPNYRLVTNIETIKKNICIIGGMLCLIAVDNPAKKKFLLNDREFEELTQKKHL